MDYKKIIIGIMILVFIFASIYVIFDLDDKITHYYVSYQHDTAWEEQDELPNSANYNYIDVQNNTNLQVHTINVAQGDSTLIVTPDNETILIDTGHAVDDGKYVLNYLDKHNVERIDYLISSHNHWDHMGGHPEVIEEYITNQNKEIGEIMGTGYSNDTPYYDQYINAIYSFGYNKTIIDSESDIKFSETVDIEIINPPPNPIESDSYLNDNSLGLYIEFQNSTILLPSDMEVASEEYVTDEYGDKIESDIYKAGHHGSNTSSTQKYLETINPEISVISSSYDSRWNHPHHPVLERHHNQDIETYWTGTHGSVVKESDGKKWKVHTQSEATTNPLDLTDESKINVPPEYGYNNTTILNSKENRIAGQN